MTKTAMMERYENETGNPSTRFVTDGVHSVGVEIWHFEYINWLVAKIVEYEYLLDQYEEERMIAEHEHGMNMYDANGMP